jgi:hypothetical protein
MPSVSVHTSVFSACFRGVVELEWQEVDAAVGTGFFDGREFRREVGRLRQIGRDFQHLPVSKSFGGKPDAAGGFGLVDEDEGGFGHANVQR